MTTTREARATEATTGGAFSRAAAGLFPGYFALVMATGIVSIAAYLLALTAAAWALLFLTLCMFLLGCTLYLLLITLIFYRFTFVNFTPILLTPPYWINMGAVAITTLAGAPHPRRAVVRAARRAATFP